ncbi:DUF4350 domain-containing protein [Wenjunlia tyrosinilytica]|uniref:DUF4350 domain-containing protein n=1 Tax=Wenjunlia tyrosinilytica TaxID=1544741 RepID=A0A917ZXJ2_9ACTN|nr:DUF4350 domain-containing protein [Wenjunlia tyrosinilytica]GGO97321.1 hypothetical protein GCM10012280_58870 [Wenjunlia tyrosinilytica]
MTTDTSTSPSLGCTSLAPTARHLWTRSRGLLAALAIVLVFGVAYAAFRSGEHHGRLDPRSPDRYGSRAVAQLLLQRGVHVDVVTSAADAAAKAGPDTTVLVTAPDLLPPPQLSALHDATAGSGGRTVLLEPGPASLSVLAPAAQAIAPADVRARAPGCRLPEAERAGKAELGGIAYETAAPGADSCYRSGGHPSLVRLPDSAGKGDTVVLGAPDALYNRRLDKQGNASLALQLLGRHPRLVWYLPSLSDNSVGAARQRGFLDLVPGGWIWGGLQLAVAVAVAALWRARRLGPVVAEPLPVTVRAAEATEGRARLYRRGNARPRAAEALRRAARARLAPLVGVPPTRAHDTEALVAAVAAHSGTPGPEVRSLLYGPAPGDDAALIRLADRLDHLERQVRTT